MLLLSFLFLLLATATPAVEPPPEVLGRTLRSVRFVCDAPIDEAELRSLIPLVAGEPVTSEGLEEARRLLDLKEIFRDIDLDLEPEDGGVVLTVRLERKRVVRSVKFSGLDDLSEKRARRIVRIDKGMIYEPDLGEAARRRLADEYVKRAFVDAEVTLDAEPVDGQLALRFRVVAGQPLVVSSVAVTGDVPADLGAKLLEEAAELKGERRTRAAVREMDRTLTRLLRDAAYYEARVSSEWEATTGGEGVVTFLVEPGPPFTVTIEGNRAKDRDDLLGLMDLGTRLIVTDGTWRELARRMRSDYERSGYHAAEVGVDVDEEDSGKRVRFRIEEGRRYVLRSIRFEGNDSLSAAVLRERMETTTGRWLPWPRSGVLVDEVLEEDRKRLRQLYREQGFRSAKIVDVRKPRDPERGTIELTVVIDEGPRTVVRAVDTAEVPPRLADSHALQVRAGEPLDRAKLSADREAIVAALRRDGHPNPKVEASITEEKAGNTIEATVHWRIDAGPRQRIGRVVVQRNIDTRARAIERVLPFEEGDPLVVEELLQGQVDLYQLGLFRSVSIHPATPEEEEVRDIAVSVSERPAGTLELGGGYNTRDGLEGLFSVGYKNVGGMARTVSLRLQASLDPRNFTPDQYLATLGFVEPRLFGSKWRYSANLVGERSTESVETFSIQRVALIQGVDRPLSQHLKGGLEAQIEQSRVFDVDPDAVLTGEDQGTLRTVALTPFLLHDTRDDAFAPKRGLLDTARLRYGLPELSSVHFAKITTQHAQFVPLFDDVVFVYSARVGWARAIFGSDLIPIRERFFLGGRTSVRGFGENSIGPRGANGSELGGDFSVNLNVELQVPIAYGFGVAFFVDGGGLYLLQCDAGCRDDRDISRAALTFDNFRRSAGAGLRYNTPVGPISLDYGIKLDRRAGESIGRLHFSIGTIF